MPHHTDPSAVRRFMAKVALPDDPDDCWLWRGAVDAEGYGHFGYEGPSIKAHRASYLMFNGSIPRGLQVDHMCHTRACVNPLHLRLVTIKQNQENRSGARYDSRSGARGVIWESRRKQWRVSVRHNSHRYYGGYFTDLAAASVAAIALRNRLYTHNDADRAST